MPKVPEPDWVEMTGPPSETVACGDGFHYRTDSKGRVNVRPYHVPELVVRDRFAIANAAVDAAYSELVSQERRPTREDLIAAIAKAATDDHTAPPEEKAPAAAQAASGADSSAAAKKAAS